MATTTTNFGWDIPQSTDLVKDGATAIATLGQDIDTSMADLKGGTTGQILSKASGTDMDFTWINNDQGDITGVTAGTGLTGGGTSGSVTLDFDVANYGGGQYAAGKNKIINGDFGIWQRGTSFTLSSGVDTYCADRFTFAAYGSGTAGTGTQQTFTPGTAPVSGYEGAYFARITNFSTATAWQFKQRIEDVRTFAGQTVTFSFWAKASVALTNSVTPDIIQNFGSGGSATVTTTLSNISLTTSWARYTVTATVPSISGKTIGAGSYVQFSFYQGSGATNSSTIDTWGWQVEAGSTATPFQTATGTKQGELAACQRYYFRTSSTGSYARFGIGRGYNSTTIEMPMYLPVPMRVQPTSVEYSSVTTTSSNTITAAALNQPTTTIASIDFTSSSLTTGNSYVVMGNNTTSAYIGVSAEL